MAKICSPILKELDKHIGVFNQYNKLLTFASGENLESISIAEDIASNGSELGETGGLFGLNSDSGST